MCIRDRIIGAVSAFMAVILLILSVAAVCIAKGYIHIGVNGDVYLSLIHI